MQTYFGKKCKTHLCSKIPHYNYKILKPILTENDLSTHFFQIIVNVAKTNKKIQQETNVPAHLSAERGHSTTIL